jgi:colicin import membrane protein
MTDQRTIPGNKLSFKARMWAAACVMLSILAHVTAVQLGLFSFPAKSHEAPSMEMPVDVITADEFSKMAAGKKDAPKKEAPKPFAEKVADAKPVDDMSAKVDKKEVTAATDQQVPLPEPKPKLPDPKPAAAPPEPKVEAKAPDKKEPEQKIDPIADALKKEEAKKPEKKAENKPVPLPPKPVPQPPKFDPRKVAALLDKRDPTRVAAAGSEINTNQNLGFNGGPAAQMSQSEIEAFRRRVRDCWIQPPGMSGDTAIKVTFRALFKADGALAAEPALVAGTNSAQGPAVAESAKRALLRCQPYTMLKREHYDQWKDMEVTFDSRDMEQM